MHRDHSSGVREPGGGDHPQRGQRLHERSALRRGPPGGAGRSPAAAAKGPDHKPPSLRRLHAGAAGMLRDPDGLALRPYQITAIEKVEAAAKAGKEKILLTMATGTGKTRVVTAIIYRFLTAGRFKRILFLVDRNSLGEQADDKFKNVKIEQLLPLTSIFSVSNLEEREFDINSQVKIATVQSMVRHVMDDTPSVSEYDLIIVDEAHRGYLLDKDIDAFAREVSRYYPINSDSLPRHYREALVLYNHRRSNPVITYKDAVLDVDYNDLQKLEASCQNDTERKGKVMESYANSYWYFFDYVSQ